MLLAPPAVVNAVVVVACAGNGCLEEVRVSKDGCRRHEASAGVSVNTHTVAIYIRILAGKLLDCVFLVFQTVIAHIAVAVVMVPLGPVRMASAVTNGDYNEANLREALQAQEAAAPGYVVSLYLRAGIYVINYRISLCGIKVEGFVHGAVKVCDAVGGLNLETLGELVAGCEQQ